MTSPVWHPFTQHGLNEPIPHVIRAEGAILHLADGSSLIDGISSWWVTTHGHCHPRIAAAIARQAGQLDQLIFAGYTHEPAEAVARGLVDLMPQTPGRDPLAHVFFSDSGSTAVEVALKMALGYWHNRALDGLGEARSRILVLEHSYHGDTIGAMSIGERGVYNAAWTPLLFDVGTVPFPHPGREQETLAALETACADHPAAFIVEPLILGAGGMLIYPPHVLRAMADICARHDVLFIADEVMTGWGRTGTLFACEQAGVVPDIMAVAKGITGGAIPLAATLATPRIFEAHRSTDRARLFYHSSSYTANAIACAAAAENLAIWAEEDVRGRIAALAQGIADRLALLAGHPAFANPRQIGTIMAIDLVAADAGYLSDLAPRLRAFFLERGLLLRPLGNTIYLMPPYCIDTQQLDAVFAALVAAGDYFGSAS
ncbi:adenosylmethionine--8-amino-7-oxononanoate transaminase [Sphingobium yanoikuyae]|jgi:adenosylmethionine-8-amino-7-oxononanoate aminotransferase|uniref:Adenosylmethionine-8-amino-7-oxononanoate aminotransferase n=1 Tax=Sphingobium yanoikuyae TaxID=13690 RepID=A0A0J9FIY2_SPHYA|nr:MULTISPECIES: adenosylmethionine--8-amino-7-oxononanoate transaminase [Sphingobium]ATP18030.1 adenosylmethionine--8-amino-7-oxononanoate aminotransferase BioA [Sphingobium yanoikuyae]KMW28460.1 adenosylmethionine-8-amino-7-oxononanoate aminotransferase [Sphingobium yanoikuyae]MDH2130824.1 adenosylmethionine--8-amino-7-oxononanoate transaminase [Sphingobium yanoikuyae]MDH2148483.1 adenosylmethionine--8-amino-7-oxononanoate transaminase [Sphingobium yanoikuyae]MDH2165007.1 adenosylmethionine-